MRSGSVSSEDSLMSAGDLGKRNGDDGKVAKMVTVSWHNLTVAVNRKIPGKNWWSTSKEEDHVILNNLTGIAKSGELTAIMGASGAGKTTLLATVSQRGKLQSGGYVLFNGRPVSRQLMAKLSGFVPQHDLVYRSLNVIEHMEFMARLVMDQRLRKIHRNRRIYCLLSDLSLLRCCKTRLGQLSGGEMKRLSLAVQLLTDPPVLFCDEPTTGLDSYSAGVVIEHLRQCAERGKAVLATIHQPASGHFELFHNVILLAAGKVAYSGPVSDASSHFNSVGLVCPTTYNPAEYYVQQLAMLPGKELECAARNSWLCAEFSESARGKALVEEVIAEMKFIPNPQTRGFLKGNWSTHSSTTSDSAPDTEVEAEREFKSYSSIVSSSWYTQIYWLTWRSFKDMTRNCADIILRFILFMLVAVIISTPYMGVSQQLTQKTIQNMQGFLYLVITEAVFTFSYSVFHTFPKEMPIFLRELANGLYKPAPFYISKMVIIFCRSSVEAILYAVFIFFVVQLDGGLEQCLLFVLPVVCASLAATAFGCVMSAAFESVATASLVSVPLELLGVMFSGLYLQLATLPSYISWIKYLSHFYYGQEAVSITQWTHVDNIDCSSPDLPCISDGEGVLNNYGYSSDNYYKDLLGLCSFYCVAHLLGFIAVLVRSRSSPVY